MTSRSNSGGVYGGRGYLYQQYYALYCLVVEEAREIGYEISGEDVVIINEDDQHNSLTIIQCKCQKSGDFSFAKFLTEVFPQLWTAFFDSYQKYEGKKALFPKLVTNVTMNADLKKIVNLCISMREKGLTLKEFEAEIQGNRRINTQYQNMKRGNDIHLFGRFLWGLRIDDQYSLPFIQERIEKHLMECGIRNPKQKMRNLHSLISDTGHGIITRRQLEENIGSPLTKIEEASGSKIFSDSDVAERSRNLISVRERLTDTSDIPNVTTYARDITQPIVRYSDVVKSRLQVAENYSSDVRTEYSDEVETLTETIRHDVDELSEIERRRWMKRREITQNITELYDIGSSMGPPEDE